MANPATPANFTATPGPGGGMVTLRWDAVTDWGAGANPGGYQVSRGPDGSETPLVFVVDGNPTSYIDTGLTPGQTYRYEIYTSNSNDETSATAEASAVARIDNGGIGSANFNRFLAPGAR